MSLTTALRCDRCKVETYVIGDERIDDARGVMHAAVKDGWLAQHTATDHTFGRAVCPSCRAAGYGKDWA